MIRPLVTPPRPAGLCNDAGASAHESVSAARRTRAPTLRGLVQQDPHGRQGRDHGRHHGHGRSRRVPVRPPRVHTAGAALHLSANACESEGARGNRGGPRGALAAACGATSTSGRAMGSWLCTRSRPSRPSTRSTASAAKSCRSRKASGYADRCTLRPDPRRLTSPAC